MIISTSWLSDVRNRIRRSTEKPARRTSEQSVRGSVVRYQIKLQAKEFLLGHAPKGRQIMLDRVPDQSFIYCFILMPIDIPRGGDSHPIDLWMAVKQFIREPPRRFRDDLQCPNYSVNRLSFHAKNLEVEAGGKSSDHIDVVDDIRQPLSRILRRHESDRAECWPGARA
jgi:hypothetical protein